MTVSGMAGLPAVSDSGVTMITLPGFLWLVKTGRITADLFH